MDRVELIIGVSDVLLGRYGKNEVREAKLKEVYGEDGATIQKAVSQQSGQPSAVAYMYTDISMRALSKGSVPTTANLNICV